MSLRRARPATAVAAALLASGAVASAPRVGAATVPGPTVTYAHALVQGEGFDMCQAPPSSTMRAWLASPMRSVNIYFAGSQRACSNQPYLSPEWVRTVTANGWSLIPTVVDRQPPCYGGKKAKISTTPSVAQQQGHDVADQAADGLAALGLPRRSPAYVDIENFPAGSATCDRSVRRFLLGWMNEMRSRGYRAGVYGLPTGAIRVLVAAHKADSSYPVPDAIWFARYDGDDSTRSADIPAGYLPGHRIHQYVGGTDRTYAGITLNIDKDAMNGDVEQAATVTPPSGPAPYMYAAAGSPNTTSTTPGAVNLRADPSTNNTAVGTVHDGDPIGIECQTVGQRINGDYIWDKIDNPNFPLSRPQYVYVSDLFTNTTGGNGASPAIAPCESDPPTVTVTPLSPATLRSSVTVSYSATDAQSGISGYDVRWRQASDRSGFGHWHYPTTWQHTTGKSETLTGLAPGGTYCLAVRAYDRLDNRSSWSSSTCVARALDDRAMTAGSAWRRLSDSVFYQGTVTSTTVGGAHVQRADERLLRVGVVATVCPTCGKVRIYVAGTRVGVIDLTADRRLRQRILMLDPFDSLRTGRMTVKVISRAKQVAIDGLVVSRR